MHTNANEKAVTFAITAYRMFDQFVSEPIKPRNIAYGKEVKPFCYCVSVSLTCVYHTTTLKKLQ